MKNKDIKYVIEQFPKNKVFDFNKLNEYQIVIRKNQKKYCYGNKFTCRKCLMNLDIKEFYIKDKHTGRRSTKCRDCQMKENGVIEIGKQRFAYAIADKGFRRCSVCKNIKPLYKFSRQKNVYLGRASNCKECNAKLLAESRKKSIEQITDSYVKQYGIRKGVTKFNKRTIDKLRQQIIERRKPKYFVDEIAFFTIVEFAKYIETNYGNPLSMTKKRIHIGYTEEECKLSEGEIRRLKSGTNKGKIKVTNKDTGEVFIFNNTKDRELLKMFSHATIDRCINQKRPTSKRNKFKQVFLIERI